MKFTIKYDDQPEEIVSKIESALSEIGIKFDVKDADDGYCKYTINTSVLDNAMKLSFEAGRKLDYQDLTILDSFDKEELAYPTFENYLEKCRNDLQKK